MANQVRLINEYRGDNKPKIVYVSEINKCRTPAGAFYALLTVNAFYYLRTVRTYNGKARPDFTPDLISSLKEDEVFVFGSNLQGMHGGGAAFAAWRKFGAVMGCGVGLQGQSYAVPTMQGGVETIKPYVDQFIGFAKAHPELFFYVTRIGCGIAGFRDRDIAPLFVEALTVENICLPDTFVRVLSD